MDGRGAGRPSRFPAPIRYHERVEERWRPTGADLEAARSKTVPDVIRRGLRILFVGINPGLYTAAIGHHFGRPGNRFWPSLCRAGLVPPGTDAWQSARLPEWGLGITNVADRATATADELGPEELRAGAKRLTRKLLKYRPRVAAFLGLGLYRVAYASPKAALGLQAERIGNTKLWVLPNPSGLNAHFQVPDYARLFRRMAREAGRDIGRDTTTGGSSRPPAHSGSAR